MSPPADLVPREYVTCNLCGADHTRLWGRKQEIDIVECCRCGLVYANPRLDEGELKRYYGAQYFRDGDYAGDELRGRMYEIEVREMLKIIGTHGRFLDVGCAYGRFLSCLPGTFEKYGVEFSEEAAAHAREKFGFDVRVGQLYEAGFDEDFFDMVHFRGVFEHLQDPQRNLEECRRVLKDNGWLLLSTVPNIKSPCGRLYRERFRLVYPREHIYYFSRRTLTRYCEKNGFRIQHVFYPYLGTPYENLWADLLAFITNYVSGRESPPFFRSVITVYARKLATTD